MGNSKDVSNFRIRRKENLIRVLGSACCLCGYNECIGALEFHHIESENKSYQLSSGNCHSLKDDLEEAKKCLLVCANCHREIHLSDKYADIDLWKYQIYNNDFANQLLYKELKELKCSKCGKEITRYSKSGMCPSCVQLGKRLVQERPDREKLKGLIRTMPFTQIANLYNCSDNAVRKWCDKENLPRKKSDIESYSDEEWKDI